MWPGRARSPGFVAGSSVAYFGSWGSNPLRYYLVFMFVGTLMGGLMSAILGRRIQPQLERGPTASPKLRILMALVGGILVIIMCSFGFVNYLIDAEVPMQILDWMQQYISNKYTFLLILNVFLLVVGCLMDIFSALIVVVPLVAPVAVGFGVDPVHLGIIFLTNLEIGYSRPRWD